MQIALVFLVFSVLVNAQTEKSRTERADVDDRSVEISLQSECELNDSIRLRLSNGDKWAIAVKTDRLYYRTGRSVKLSNGREFYVLPVDTDIGLQYYVDKFAFPNEKVQIPAIPASDNSFVGWIAPRDSISFSVPKKYLRDDLMILVRISYEWEMTKTGALLTSSEHRLVFRGIDLPESLRKCR